jgi:hypothetical protein
VPPALGLPSPGVGLRSSGVGEAEAVAVEVGIGVAVGGCATETAAPTTVSSAAAAQMIWARRRKLATMRPRSATMERDYKPGAIAVDYHPAKAWSGGAKPDVACSRGRTDRAWAEHHLKFATAGGPMSSVKSAADDALPTPRNPFGRAGWSGDNDHCPAPPRLAWSFRPHRMRPV